jgi:hypothetical protein
MTRRKLKGTRKELASKEDKNKSIVTEEVNFREARKNLLKDEYTFDESNQCTKCILHC